MRTITKSQEPQSLKVFNRVHHTEWSDIHDPNNRYVYNDCLEQCKLDQRGLCAYTEISFNDAGTIHIDHYIKRDIDSSLMFSWANLAAAVKDSRYGADHKDTNVSRKDYSKRLGCYYNLLNPIINNLSGLFKYSADGEIEPINAGDVAAINTIRVFNLNESTLKARRKDCMQNVRLLLEGGLNKQEVLNVLSSGGFLSAIEYELNLVK